MKNLKPNLIIVRILTNYMRYMKKGWRYIIDNKITNKLKSIAVNTYILTVFFWIVLTTSMILLLLIVIDLSDVIKSSSIWYTSIGVALAGFVILLGIFSTVKDIRESKPILCIYLLIIVIFLLIAWIDLVDSIRNEMLVTVLITIFIISIYIMNFFPAYFLAREIVGSYKGFKELFTKKITKITTTYEENKKNVTKEITTEENPIGIIIFSIVIPVVLSVIKLLVSN